MIFVTNAVWVSIEELLWVFCVRNILQHHRVMIYRVEALKRNIYETFYPCIYESICHL